MSLRTVFLHPEKGLRNGWRMLLFALSAMLVLVPLGALVRHMGGPSWLRLPLRSSATPCLVILGLSLAALRLERRPLASFGMRPDLRFAGEFTLGLLVGALLIGVAALTAWGAGGFHWVRSEGASLQTLMLALISTLGGALIEELIFRGYLFQRLVEGVGLRLALALGATFFALAHWQNPGMQGSTKIWATCNIALAAVLLGLAWHRTGRLALPIGIHLAWNWAQGPLLGFAVSGTGPGGFLAPVLHGRPDWLTGGAFGLEASLPGSLVLLVPVILLARMKPRAS